MRGFVGTERRPLVTIQDGAAAPCRRLTAGLGQSEAAACTREESLDRRRIRSARGRLVVIRIRQRHRQHGEQDDRKRDDRSLAAWGLPGFHTLRAEKNPRGQG